MVDARRMKLEQRVQNRIGYISNVSELSDENLEAIESGALGVLDREVKPLSFVSLDTRPLHERVIGFRLW